MVRAMLSPPITIHACKSRCVSDTAISGEYIVMQPCWIFCVGTVVSCNAHQLTLIAKVIYVYFLFNSI